MTPAAAVDPHLPLRGKVVCIEDDPFVFEIVAASLSHHPGVQLVHAATGSEGVRLVRADPPQFVLLDMHLPDMSGVEVVRLLSEEIAQRRLRVTILTGDSLTMDVIKAMSLGAFEYWRKPLDPTMLETGVRRALGGKRADQRYTLRNGQGGA